MLLLGGSINRDSDGSYQRAVSGQNQIIDTTRASNSAFTSVTSESIILEKIVEEPDPYAGCNSHFFAKRL